ncbi:hypothetical protein M9H77_16646 [Catharanthus roseus]|uniref:Uncharacterized protein n=1 Tax=Catharanthus roseus TaxID=4058 RepID=A0ACC0B2D6_CATRO|nr:hypothetical protein M9H77_16646 [Catharanthus roseus]
MATTIDVVFPKTRHRLCIWHILDNSKKHIMGLRHKHDFIKLFNHVLKDTDILSLNLISIRGVYAYLFEYVCLILGRSVPSITGSSIVGDERKGSKNDMVHSSVWRRGILRKFLDLISASESNMNARECIEEGFKMMKGKIIAEVGPYYMDNSENEGRSCGIKDPVGRCTKRIRNVRKKSIVEIKCNQARGKRKSTSTRASRIQTTVQLSMTNEDLEKDLNAQSSEGQLSLEIYNFSDVDVSINSETFISFM